MPSFIDIQVILHQKQQQNIKIRLPLEHILKNTQHDTLMNVRMEDIKPGVRSLLQKEGFIRVADWSNDDIKLCWRTKVTSDDYEVSNQNDSSRDRIEWITQSTELIGLQLIEQVCRIICRMSLI